MITRQIARRHCRALARIGLLRPQVLQHRAYAKEVEGIEISVDNAFREPHSIERTLEGASTGPVSKIENQTYQRFDPETAKIAEKYNILQHHNATTGNYGASVAHHYRPNDVLVNPPSPADITPELLLASQAHMGHSTSLWNPMNSKYIHGVREGIHIISLEETAAHLKLACKVVSGVAERGGLILFAGTRREQERSVVLAAKLSKGYHLFNKWMPGAITNKEQILGSYQTKLVDEFDREMVINPELLRQAPALTPDLVVCLNPIENWTMLHECALNNIPTIGIIDTDADPTWVTYPIPANDDSLRCTNLIAGVLGRAGEDGQRIRMERTSRGDIPYDEFKLPNANAMGELHSRRLDADKNKEYEIEYRDENNMPMTQEQFEEERRAGAVIDDSMMEVFMDGNGGDIKDDAPYFSDDETGEVVREQWSVFDEIRTQGQDAIEAPSQQRPRIEGVDVAARPSEAFARERTSSLEDPARAERLDVDSTEKMAQAEEVDAVQAANKIPDDGRQKALNDEKKDKSH